MNGRPVGCGLRRPPGGAGQGLAEEHQQPIATPSAPSVRAAGSGRRSYVPHFSSSPCRSAASDSTTITLHRFRVSSRQRSVLRGPQWPPLRIVMCADEQSVHCADLRKSANTVVAWRIRASQNLNSRKVTFPSASRRPGWRRRCGDVGIVLAKGPNHFSSLVPVSYRARRRRVESNHLAESFRVHASRKRKWTGRINLGESADRGQRAMYIRQ